MMVKDLENPVPTETTPLIGDGSDEDRGILVGEPPPLGDIPEYTVMERIVGAVGVVGLSSSLASIALESNPVVYISGALGAVVSPMAAIQQNKLTQVVALKETNARLRGEVDQLKAENVKLSSHVSSLETSVSHLQDISTTLEMVRSMEGQSLEELEKQVADSERILDQMQDNLRGSIVQTLISTVLAIDHDGDMCLSDAEIDSLIHQVEEMSAGSYDFKDALLRQKLIENGRSLNAVMDIIKDLMDSDAKPEDSIFAFIHKTEVPSTLEAAPAVTEGVAPPPQEASSVAPAQVTPLQAVTEPAEPEQSVEVELSSNLEVPSQDEPSPKVDAPV